MKPPRHCVIAHCEKRASVQLLTFDDQVKLVGDDRLHKVVQVAGVDARVRVGEALNTQPIALNKQQPIY